MPLLQSVCRWCFGEIPLPELAAWAVELGIDGIDLLHPHEVSEITPFGLKCPVTAAPEDESGLGCIDKAFNQTEHHQTLWRIYEELIPAAAEAGISQVITFSGNRDGLSDENGLENCARGLDPLLALAEQYDVTLVMELLNSRIDHPDYQCDRTHWGAALCEKLDSPRFKLLYDVYHMQVMEGDIIATIQRYSKYINHYHAAGNPGRHELDETQELNYPAIVRAIRDTGFEGYLAQEFVPTWSDHKAALADAVSRCR